MAKPGKLYLQLDCDYFDDADILELSDLAQLHDVRGMAYSKRLQSDGCLTERQFARIAPDSPGDTRGELVGRGIWLDKGDHLERRNWLAWNESAENIEAISRGGKRGNHVKWHVRGKKPPSSDCEWCVRDGLASPPESGASIGATRGEHRGDSLDREEIDVDVEAEVEETTTSSANDLHGAVVVVAPKPEWTMLPQSLLVARHEATAVDITRELWPDDVGAQTRNLDLWRESRKVPA
jgi:hypothetical protein